MNVAAKKLMTRLREDHLALRVKMERSPASDAIRVTAYGNGVACWEDVDDGSTTDEMSLAAGRVAGRLLHELL